MKATSTALKAWLALTTATVLALGGANFAQAATLTHNAWGTNYSVVCTGYDALQFNATRNPGEGGPPFAGNTLLMLSDVTYWYPNYPCYESTTWTSNGTGRKAAKVSGAYMNLDAIDPADVYVRTDRFIKLRNLTIDNVDLDYDNATIWFYTSGAVSPAPDMSLTLKNGSITGLNRPGAFDSRAKFNLSTTGNSGISNWMEQIHVQSPTTMNVTGAGSKLTFFRVGKTSGKYFDGLYFSGAGNTATIDGASVVIADSAGKLKTEVLDVFGSNSIALPQEYSPTNYSVTAGVVLMEPDSILTLNGQGSLASDTQLLWDPATPSGHYGQIIINDNASLVSNHGDFRFNPGARITINRSSHAHGALIVKNGGAVELLGSSSYHANFSSQGELSASSNGTIAVGSETINILGGSQGMIGIESDGTLMIGNFGTTVGATVGATAVLNTHNDGWSC